MTVADGLHQSATIRDELLSLNDRILYYGRLLDSCSQRLQKIDYLSNQPRRKHCLLVSNHLLTWVITSLGSTSLDTNVNNQAVAQVDDGSD